MEQTGSWVWVGETEDMRPSADANEIAALTARRSRDAAFRRLGEALPSGIAEFDEAGEQIYANGQIARITGTTTTCLDDYLGLVPGSEREALSKALASHRTDGVDLDMEIALAGAGSRPATQCRLSLRTIPSEDQKNAGSVMYLDDITERWNSERVLARQASCDALTDLPNRSTIVQVLEEALASETIGHTAVMFFDLDGFKAVNDRYGHAAGDDLLRVVSAAFTQALRPGDVVGRQGGDEFIVVCRSVEDEKDALRIANRLLDFVTGKVSLGEHSVVVRCSCGIALSDETFQRIDADDSFNDGASPAERLISHADLAMYEHKRTRSRSPSLFHSELFDAHRLELERSDALRTVGEDDSLSAWYQPIVEMGTGQVIGYEALARWNYRGELLPPNLFIGLAERRGMIDELGAWMLRETCMVARAASSP